MLQNMKVTVIVPTLNEAKGIKATLQLVPSSVDEILVVDGDSKDGTGEIAKACGARVIVEKRRGYGLAFLVGFQHATGDIIATMDGDGTYPIEVLPQVVDQLVERKLDFISCNRFPLDDKGSMRTQNHIGNQLMTMAASTLFMHPFKDILSGMWVFRRSCLSELNLQSYGWNLSEEIKVEAYRKLGARFAEYKIPYRERLGETKLVPWKVGLANVAYLGAMRLGVQRFLNHF